jgi:hypothetical protein
MNDNSNNNNNNKKKNDDAEKPQWNILLSELQEKQQKRLQRQQKRASVRKSIQKNNSSINSPRFNPYGSQLNSPRSHSSSNAQRSNTQSNIHNNRVYAQATLPRSNTQINAQRQNNPLNPSRGNNQTNTQRQNNQLNSPRLNSHTQSPRSRTQKNTSPQTPTTFEDFLNSSSSFEQFKLLELKEEMNRPRSRSAIKLTRTQSDASNIDLSNLLQSSPSTSSTETSVTSQQLLEQHEALKVQANNLQKEREKFEKEKKEFEEAKEQFGKYMKREKEFIEQEKKRLAELEEKLKVLQAKIGQRNISTELTPKTMDILEKEGSEESSEFAEQKEEETELLAEQSHPIQSDETVLNSSVTPILSSDEGKAPIEQEETKVNQEQSKEETEERSNQIQNKEEEENKIEITIEEDPNNEQQNTSADTPAAETETDADAEAYNSYVLQRLQKHRTVANIYEYKDILAEDDITSIRRASVISRAQIDKEVSLLIGERNTWSSESEEVQMFRASMKQIHSNSINERFTQDFEQIILPPMYLTSDPAALTFDKKDLMCKIFIPHLDSYKTIPCRPDNTADELIEKFISKATQTNLNLRKMLTKEKILFKASGSSDYIYGNVPLIQFEHVWNCVKSGARVALTAISWDSLWEEIDPHDLALKSLSYDYNQLNTAKLDPSKYIMAWDVSEPFRIKLCSIENLRMEFSNLELYFMAEILMGNLPLTQERFSQTFELDRASNLGQYINFVDTWVSELPREATLRLSCYSRPKSSNRMITAVGSKDQLVAAVTVPIYNHDGILKDGICKFRMWKELKRFICMENNDFSSDAPSLYVEFDKREKSVAYIQGAMKLPAQLPSRWMKYEHKRVESYSKLTHKELLAEFNRIVNSDPLYQLNEEERFRLWSVRSSAHLLTSNSKALPKFMQSVPWQHPQAVALAYQLLDKWEKMTPADAIGLLNYNYADTKLRIYAVKILSQLSDNELKELLLQLVQALKFELYHDSALARLLIERSLKSKNIIGHVMFWHMKAEMHDPCIRERYGLILEEYLTHCGAHRRELLKQNGIVDQLFNIAMIIKETKKADQVTVLRQELAKMTIPPKFKLPLSTRVDLKGILIDKCKVMNSKKLPLWLVFENADRTGDPVYVIFKAGDDLRQDLLTLQMLKNMDVLWKNHSLHLRLSPYGCVCLGDMIGMIEVVLNSDTVANITNERGGASAAFSVDPLTIWLKKHCRSEEDWKECVQNFIESCAAYCVATYVLGIGDRHNDNIMLKKNGDLFHIDFGHFLGNFKSFKGIYKRETTPFVFTPMYAHVMGGTDAEDYKKFVSLGCEAYLILRKYGHTLMNMFMLMLAAGIPELTNLEDIHWLRKVLVLELSSEDARKHFIKKIKKSLKNTRARINDAVHIYAKK